MGLNKKYIKSATAASQIQFAISLLHAAITKGKVGCDFAKILKIMLKTLEKIPDADHPLIASIRKDIKRACRIRHRYSHQNFDIRRFQEDIECLQNIAEFIRADEVVTEIDKFIKITSGK